MDSQQDSLALRAQAIFNTLHQIYPDAHCSLNFQNPLQLLISTILSAQCTDDRVNLVTKDLFNKYPTVRTFAKVELTELEQDIRSTGFYRNKAKNIKSACQKIVEQYKSIVPQTMEELLTLPGVARKTANVVLGNAFDIAVGIVVDTHVHRLTHRMGLSKQKTPEKIEQDLMKLFTPDQWIKVGHLLIYHGRKICTAQKPECGLCPIAKYCPKIFL